MAAELCGPGHDGYLRGRLHGAIEGRLDWSGTGLSCDGMLRPDGAGIRLHFSGLLDDGSRLSFIVGIEGRHDRLAGREWPANLTLIAEGEGRFFATAGAGRCRAGIHEVQSLEEGRLGIAGELWCVGGVPSLSDAQSVLPEELKFRGRFTADAD